MENIIVPKRLNEAQLVLLRLFDRPVVNEEVTELRDLLVAYYNQKLEIELNKVMADKQLNLEDIDQLGNFENRTEKLRQIRKRS
jgi:hypothetical protein